MKLSFFVCILTLLTSYATAEMRTWSPNKGSAFEGEFISVIGDKAVFRNARGKQIKIPTSLLTEEDKKFISLLNPPKLKITFVKSSSTRTIQTSPVFQEAPPRINDFTFGAKLKQTSAGTYKNRLELEYFAIGQEIRGNKYILLDRESTPFELSKENDLSFSYTGERVIEIMQYDMKDRTFGRQYAGNLVTVTDERGEIIAYTTSNEWLMDNIEALKMLPIGAYFDKTCTRCYPTPPKSWY